MAVHLGPTYMIRLAHNGNADIAKLQLEANRLGTHYRKEGEEKWAGLLPNHPIDVDGLIGSDTTRLVQKVAVIQEGLAAPEPPHLVQDKLVKDKATIKLNALYIARVFQEEGNRQGLSAAVAVPKREAPPVAVPSELPKNPGGSSLKTVAIVGGIALTVWFFTRR